MKASQMRTYLTFFAIAFLVLVIHISCNNDSSIDLHGNWKMDLVNPCFIGGPTYGLPAIIAQNGREFNARYEWRDRHGLLVLSGRFEGLIQYGIVEGTYIENPDTYDSKTGRFKGAVNNNKFTLHIYAMPEGIYYYSCTEYDTIFTRQ